MLPLFQSASTTAATCARARLPGVAAILTTGRRTVTNLLRTVAGLTDGDSPGYHRVLSVAQWFGLKLACLLTRFILQHFWPYARARLVGDDTVTEHPGRKVHDKARHRAPVCSGHADTAWRWGHTWVVLAVLVPFPCTRRPWALPVLVALDRAAEDNRRRGRPHRTPAQRLRLLLRLWRRWLPGRPFIVTGDQNDGGHDMAALVPWTGGRLPVLRTFYPDAALYEPPPGYDGRGRPRVQGAKRTTPQEVVAQAERARSNVTWYGGGRRGVEVVSGIGHGYRAGQGPVPVR